MSYPARAEGLGKYDKEKKKEIKKADIHFEEWRRWTWAKVIIGTRTFIRKRKQKLITTWKVEYWIEGFFFLWNSACNNLWISVSNYGMIYVNMKVHEKDISHVGLIYFREIFWLSLLEVSSSVAHICCYPFSPLKRECLRFIHSSALRLLHDSLD